MITLYSTGCPRCKVLKQKLDAVGASYTINDNVEDMIKKGIMTVPMLDVDGTVMDFPMAFQYVSTLQAGE